MSFHHLVRVGSLGHVGRFFSADAVRYPRHSRVVLRTERGLELGQVLAPPDESGGSSSADGQILRGMTVEDDLLQTRLEKHRQTAYDACVALLKENNLTAALIDVEHLFDGQGLYFYFLGEVTPELEACTTQLAETYEAKVQFRKFTETLLEGCGPDCGTEKAMGQGGCDSCSTCAIASACSTRKEAAPQS